MFDKRVFFFRCITYTNRDCWDLAGRLRGALHATGSFDIDEAPLNISLIEGEPLWELLVSPVPSLLVNYFKGLNPPEAFYTSVEEGPPVSWASAPEGSLAYLKDIAYSQKEKTTSAFERDALLESCGVKASFKSSMLGNALNSRHGGWRIPDPQQYARGRVLYGYKPLW